MLQNQICLNLNHHLTLAKSHNSQTLHTESRTETVINSRIAHLVSCICQKRFLLNFINVFYILNKKRAF